MLGLCPPAIPYQVCPPPLFLISQDWLQEWPGGNHNSGPDNRRVGRITALLQAANGVGGEGEKDQGFTALVLRNHIPEGHWLGGTRGHGLLPLPFTWVPLSQNLPLSLTLT